MFILGYLGFCEVDNCFQINDSYLFTMNSNNNYTLKYHLNKEDSSEFFKFIEDSISNKELFITYIKDDGAFEIYRIRCVKFTFNYKSKITVDFRLEREV